ncbi:MAG: FeoB-associated Cys-rich membrane protein [Clostridiales bacterium]|nr:FeoB-associated Cys-rich membrane protein [Clostridiales bacterium]
MITFFAENIGTIITGLVLLGIVAAAAAKIRRDKKKGGCAGCSCGCTDSSASSCCGDSPSQK